MKHRGVWIVILMLAGFAGAASYTLLVNPEINRPLGLDRFDEGAVRAKVLATAQRLLDNPGDLDVRLAQSTDTKTLRKMQELFGFEAANYWAEREVPIQRWTYRIFKPKPIRNFNPFKPDQPTLEAQVASTGRILALSVPPRKDVAPIKLTPEAALATSEKLLRLLGVDVGQITLTSTRSGEEEGRQTFDFGWKQPVKALPGLSYHYGVQLQSGYLTSFERSAVLAEDQPANPWGDLFFPLLSGATWFFLALVLLFLLIHKLRRDEMDFRHAQKVGILAGSLALVRFGMAASQSIWETLLAAALMGVLSALFFGALWGASESFLRQMAGEKLRTVDYLLEGRWTIRDTARQIILGGAAGLSLMAVPLALIAAARTWRSPAIILLPIDFPLGDLGFPGALVGSALLGPLPMVFLVGVCFLGVVYPVVRARLPFWFGGALFASLFSLAISWNMPLGPAPVALGVSLLVGTALFAAMEMGGWPAAFALLFVPATVSRVALLLTAESNAILRQGWFSLAILLAAFFALSYVALFGKEGSEAGTYEPEYLARIRERERFTRELEIAKGVQERFLPKETPRIEGFSLSTRCLPAMEVGGDYFDFLPLPGGSWLLLLGDISGKGVKAAFYMTLTKGILHAIATSEQDQIEILRKLNRIFLSQSEPGVFLTLCAVVLNPVTREAKIISAGHNPPLLKRRSGTQVLQPRGLVLGLMGDEMFLKSLKTVSVTLEPGDTLVLYTDGVNEAMDKDCQEFGMERLEHVVETGSARADALLHAIVDSVVAFQGTAPQADDLTLMVIHADEA